jgi:hypothetical protein
MLSIYILVFCYLFRYEKPMATKKPQVLLTLDEKLLERIEDYRYENRIPTRSEAMRRLIKEGLKKFKNEILCR